MSPGFQQRGWLKYRCPTWGYRELWWASPRACAGSFPFRGTAARFTLLQTPLATGQGGQLHEGVYMCVCVHTCGHRAHHVALWQRGFTDQQLAFMEVSSVGRSGCSRRTSSRDWAVIAVTGFSETKAQPPLSNKPSTGFWSHERLPLVNKRTLLEIPSSALT